MLLQKLEFSNLENVELQKTNSIIKVYNLVLKISSKSPQKEALSLLLTLYFIWQLKLLPGFWGLSSQMKYKRDK